MIGFFGFNYLSENLINIPTSIDANVYVSKKISSGIIVDYKNTKIYVSTYDNLSVDDLINLKSTNVQKINAKSSFEFYLKSEKVDFIANKATISFLGTKRSLRRKINDYFMSGTAYYSRYVSLILLGVRNSKNEIIVNKLKNISIIHLFTISDFHINILILLMHRILKKLRIRNKYIYLLCIFLLLPYIFIMGMPIAATRAFIFSFLCALNKYFFNKKFHILNLLALTMIIFFVINPYCIFSFSFIFTYVLNYGIILVNLFKNKKFIKIKFYLFTWIFSSLINIQINNEINLLSIISSLFFGQIISFSYLITFMFFWLKPVIDNYYFFIDVLINIFQYIKISISINIEIYFVVFVTLIVYLIQIYLIKKPEKELINLNISRKQVQWWLNN